MTGWQPNCGYPPTRDQPEGEKPIEYVWVRLRNGTQPKERWPVSTGRAETTRWTLQGHSHDIVEWAPA